MLINPQWLARDIVAYSLQNGFEPTTWDTAPVRFRCIEREISELVEKLEAWDGDRLAPEARAARLELADVAIYSLLLLAHLGNEQWAFRRGLQERITIFAAPERIVRPLRRYSDLAFEAWRRGDVRRNRQDVLQALELLVVVCAVMAGKFFGASLDLIVNEKLTVLRTRLPAHGGKDPRS